MNTHDLNSELALEGSKKSLSHRLLSILAFVLHPILMPTYAYLVLSNAELFSWLIPAPASYYVTLSIFSLTAIVPALLFVLMKRFTIIKSYQMATNQERVIPLILMTLIYLTVYLYIRPYPVFFLASMILLFAFVSSSLSLITNFLIKVSLHCIGISTFVGMTISISMYYGVNMLHIILGGLIISGVAGYVRLALKAHSNTEVYLGYVIGFLSAVLTNYLLKLF